jgi:hypothetical protein
MDPVSPSSLSDYMLEDREERKYIVGDDNERFM